MVDDYFDGYPSSRRVYDALARAVQRVGPVEVRVTKSQVAFRRQRAFAWAWIPSKYLAGDRPPLVCSIALRHRDPSSRWKEVVEPRPGWFMHHIELNSESAVDDELVVWLREAWEAASPA